MPSNSAMIRKLQMALNRKGDKILYSTSQFYSDDAHKAITVHHIKRAVFDEEKGRTFNIELFKSTSMIQIVLFLRDLWYDANGMEIPDNNDTWSNIKNSYDN